MTGPARWHVTLEARKVIVRKHSCDHLGCSLFTSHYLTHAAALEGAIRKARKISPRRQSDYTLAQGGPTA